MAVIDVVVLSTTSDIDINGQNTHTVKALVETNSSSDNSLTAAIGCNVNWGQYFNIGTNADVNAKVTHFNSVPLNEDEKYFYVVTVTYKSHIPELFNPVMGGGGGAGGNNGAPVTNPTERVPIISVDSEVYQESVPVDIDGNALTMTNGVPFKWTVDRQYGVINVSINKLNPGNATTDLTFKVNEASTTLLGVTYTAGKLLCKRHVWRQAFENNIEYWHHDYVLWEKLTDTQNWHQTKIVNEGTMVKDGNGGLKPIYINGAKVTEPVLINEDGDDITTTPHYLTKDFYLDGDFSTILTP